VTREEIKKGTPAIGYLIEQRLRLRAAADEAKMEAHPDEDTITAFVEARLESAENARLVSHLVVCGNCRRTTAELVRLESEFGEPVESTPFDESPGRLGEFLTGLASHLVPPTEAEVFAYQNPETEEPTKTEADSDPDQKAPDKL